MLQLSCMQKQDQKHLFQRIAFNQVGREETIPTLLLVLLAVFLVTGSLVVANRYFGIQGASADDGLSAVEFFELGENYYEDGAYPKAIAAYSNAVFLDPGNYAAFLNRGTALLNLGDVQSAIADFNRAIVLDPDQTDPYMRRALAFIQLGAYDEALRDYHHALIVNPTLSDAYAGRGTVFLHLQAYNKAIAAYDHAKAMSPNNEVFAEYLGHAYYLRGVMQLDAGKYGDAAEDFTMSLDYLPTSAEVLYQRATCFEKMGEIDQAVADYQTVVSLDTAAPLHDQAQSRLMVLSEENHQ